MPDPVHAVAKYADRNRWTALLGPALAVTVFLFVGCSAWDGRVVSSSTGEVVTAEERDAEFIAERNAIQAAIEAEQATIAASMARLDTLAAKAAAADEAYTIDRDAIEAELAEKQARLGGLIDIARPFIASLPYGETGLNAVMIALGLGGAGYGVGKRLDNKRKDKVIARKDAIAKAAAIKAAS